MNYGVYKFGSFNQVKCECGWEGVRADLRKAFVVLEQTKCGTIFDAEDVYICPECGARKY
ncbi:hypothetical protein [Bacillus thermotolerans]|uniref:Uncharacterized protein n=1 Tax=Bacillus thermotolerans TaxID=1221996 RepID=A0A0F5IA29_BACTR|nr:hypothetical protein [Bacillus thermotolerans]KKB38858.1 hypothetical protein QY97_01101 [Bacillus thermotolerans]KKB42474.1 hypothetical protein QY95_00323 [Bacillus thermotolerans]KKB44578.1 hypothetical protein QY96_02198 [Bacillus thermotolerans]